MKKIDKLDKWLDSLPEPAYVVVMAIMFLVIAFGTPTVIGGITIFICTLLGV